MARHWQIRHKLMLGLCLVAGIIALLLAGTLKGLASYRATMGSMDSKLIELNEAFALKEAMRELAAQPDAKTDLRNERTKLESKMQIARQALKAYADKLQDTVQRRRDPDGGFNENQLMQALDERFDTLTKVIAQFYEYQARDLDPTVPLRYDPQVDKAINNLVQATDELQPAIYEDIFRRITEAKDDYKSSMWIVLSTSVVGLLLMAGLLRFFYRWVFDPVRDLQQGVGRVAQGDFEHRIEVHSGDEMEELAAAFNNMTGRLRDMYHDLARQVNERSRQLVRSERLASVGFLAAGVAHEINNPLASIAFCSEALEVRLKDLLEGRAPGAGLSLQLAESNPQADKDVITKYLRMIQQEAFRCKQITERLLQFSRPGERRREPTDLAELVQSVLDMTQHLQNCKGKEIVFQPAERVTAWVNAQEVKSVVLNLVVNSLDSMDEKGTLSIQVRQQDGMAEVCFTDTGCGMTAEVLENIFEPFFTRSRTGKGTGLGLTISHRIITQHGGEIEAASPGPNQGSTFTVRLPVQPAEPVKEESFGHAAA